MSQDAFKEAKFENFGTYGPGFFLNKLIQCSRQWCDSSFLKPFSSLCRKLALNFFLNGPVDYDFRGVNVRFNPSDNLAEKRGLLKPSAFDPVELDFIAQTLPSGGIFLDIGANVGLYSLTSAVVAGKNGLILAFEPSPIVFERLCCNIALNSGREDIGKIIPLPLAVTDRTGPVRFVLPTNNLGEGRVTPASLGREILEVEGIMLLDALNKHSIDRVNIMKVDIEGSELSALQPFFRESPHQLHPEYIIIERGENSHWQSLLYLCQEFGYQAIKSCRVNEIFKKINSSE